MNCYQKSNPYLFVNALLSQTNIMHLFLVILSLLNVVLGEECRQINNCKCKFTNGSVIDLTSLGYQHEARFKNVTPVSVDKSYTYYYNPCFPFTLEGVCTNVAVCQVSKTKQYQNCGFPNNGFIWNSEHNALNLIYTAGAIYTADYRITNVTLVCNKEAETPILVVQGEPQTNHYEMTLTSRCACPDLCREDHLSAGSVLVILFLIFVSLYLVLGIIHSNLTRGAHGWEMIPHYEFWADFPLLVRDGCVFVMSGCKAETAYERI